MKHEDVAEVAVLIQAIQVQVQGQVQTLNVDRSDVKSRMTSMMSTSWGYRRMPSVV